MDRLSNHEMAKRYDSKQKLLGKRVLDFVLLSDDRVMLRGVLDKEDTGRLVIPSFITEIKELGVTSWVYDSTKNEAVMGGCKYSEVYIDNVGDRDISLNSLCAYMESEKLKVHIRHWDKVVNIKNMFNGCVYIEELDLGDGIDTSNIEDMNGLFCGCVNLEAVDISKFNTSRVEDMSNMFSGCHLLKEIDVSHFDTRNVRDMSFMFYNCRSIVGIDVSKFNTSRVEDMSGMFSGCETLKNIDVTKFDTRSLNSIASMFSECWELKELKVWNLDTSNVYDACYVFKNCISLVDIDISKWDLTSVINIKGLFRGCGDLERVKMGRLPTKLYRVITPIDLFKECKNLISVDISELKDDIDSIEIIVSELNKVKDKIYVVLDTSIINKYDEYGMNKLSSRLGKYRMSYTVK